MNAAFRVFAVVVALTVGAVALNPSPPPSPVRLIFLHHSTGAAWLRDDHGGLGIALRDSNYYVSDTTYGWGPSAIGDHTDIGDWWTWFRGENATTIMSRVYTEGKQMTSYKRLAVAPSGENSIVMFKSCYPNSALRAGGAVPNITANPLKGKSVGSSVFTVPNAMGIYIDLLEYFKKHTDKLFVVITAPPLVSSTYGANARQFNEWLSNTKDGWLKNYPFTNVAVFDYFNVLSAASATHRYVGPSIEHIVVRNYDLSFYPTSDKDSHPNKEGDVKATGQFVSLLNVYYNRWAAGINRTWGDIEATTTYESDATRPVAMAFAAVVVASVAALYL